MAKQMLREWWFWFSLLVMLIPVLLTIAFVLPIATTPY
jgi:hypothetical protein